MSLTVHFYDTDCEDTKINIFNGTLGVILLEDRHTSQNLADELKKLCNEWGIQNENITAVVTDNVANIKKAVDIGFGSNKHIPCFAHTLNLVAERSLEMSEEVSLLIIKVKSIVTWFKQSVVGSNDLR